MCLLPALAWGLPGRERGANSVLLLEEGGSAIIPILRQWQVPRDLYGLYPWGGYRYTNYARQNYRRYIDPNLEGTLQYDRFGNYVVRGRKVYEWREEQSGPLGSSVLKGGSFGGWFRNLVVAADSKGQYYTALTVANDIRTTLTPLTFSKARFNGVQWDWAADRFSWTLLASRASDPITQRQASDQLERSDYTQFLGGRGIVQVGPFLTLGATWVNAYFGTSRSSLAENSLKGLPTSYQNDGSVTEITVRIADDSPGDGVGPLYYSGVMLVDGQAGRVAPFVEGGVQQGGARMALEGQPILLQFRVPAPETVRRIDFELVVANDYRVDMTSNRQLNIEGRPVFLPVSRAQGNVQDNTNRRLLRFAYGLPTATRIASLSGELADFWGLAGRAEFARNWRYSRFPNIAETRLSGLKSSQQQADAWYGYVSRRWGRWMLAGETFSMDYDYLSRAYIPDQNGVVDYENERDNFFEFIDDDDDGDGVVDWPRFEDGNGQGDTAIFPGYDENNDQISDFNENNNLVPDYLEPFIRHYVDHPDLLFGIDMNNNGVVDRFENDEEPDYPYRRDQRGYNLYLTQAVWPQVHITAGRSRQRLLAGDGVNKQWYGLLSAAWDRPGGGRFEVFQMLKKVRDSIRDDLVLWNQQPGTEGVMVPYVDPLVGIDGLVNQAYLGYAYGKGGLTMRHKIRLDRYGRKNGPATTLVGLVDKADYRWDTAGGSTLVLRWKSAWRRRRDPGRPITKTDQVSQIGSFTLALPFLSRSWIEVGVEGHFFRNRRPLPAVPSSQYSDDFSARALALQYTNRGQFQGYNIIAHVGLLQQQTAYVHWDQLDVSSAIAFIEIFAGLGEDSLGGRPAQRRRGYRPLN